MRGPIQDRRTLVDAALSIGSWATTESPGPLSQTRILQLRLLVLLTVEAFPVAGGLLRG
jgi:hypothetical protein